MPEKAVKPARKRATPRKTAVKTELGVQDREMAVGAQEQIATRAEEQIATRAHEDIATCAREDIATRAREDIATRAYYIYLEEGHADQLANWLRAERELTAA